MRLAIGPLFCILFSVTVLSQETTQNLTDTVKVFASEAGEYQFTESGLADALQLRSQPLLHWSNPARNGEDGAVFLWTQGERPKVIGTCFTFNYQSQVRHKHAFHSLSEQAIQGRYRTSPMWSPPKDSLQWNVVPDAPEPIGNATQRTIQLRNLARRFAVQVTTKKGVERGRLVPQPLYRYETEEKDPISGAIFAHSVGTDPEAFVMFETRPQADGKRIWHYAFVRFTFAKLEGFLDEKPVWSVEPMESLMQSILTRADYQRLPYITFRAEWLLKK